MSRKNIAKLCTSVKTKHIHKICIHNTKGLAKRNGLTKHKTQKANKHRIKWKCIHNNHRNEIVENEKKQQQKFPLFGILFRLFLLELFLLWRCALSSKFIDYINSREKMIICVCMRLPRLTLIHTHERVTHFENFLFRLNFLIAFCSFFPCSGSQFQIFHLKKKRNKKIV